MMHISDDLQQKRVGEDYEQERTVTCTHIHSTCLHHGSPAFGTETNCRVTEEGEEEEEEEGDMGG